MTTRFFSKKATAFLLFLFIALQAQAQVTVKPGVRGGLGVNALTDDRFDAKPDFYVGGLAEIKLAKFYTLQPELNYTRQGATARYHYIDPYGYINSNKDYSIQYLNVNLINKFYVFHGFHALIGPSLDFKLADNMDEFPDDVRGYDIGLNFGLGYTFPIGLTVETRFKGGFMDIFGYDYDYYENNDFPNNSFNDVVLNTALQIGVTYTFDIKNNKTINHL